MAQPKLSSDRYERKKMDYTAKKLRELEESEEYKKYRRDKQMGRLKEMEDDDTVDELR